MAAAPVPCQTPPTGGARHAEVRTADARPETALRTASVPYVDLLVRTSEPVLDRAADVVGTVEGVGVVAPETLLGPRSERRRTGHKVAARVAGATKDRSATTTPLVRSARPRAQAEERVDDATGRKVRKRAPGVGPGRTEKATRVDVRSPVPSVEGVRHQAPGEASCHD